MLYFTSPHPAVMGKRKIDVWITACEIECEMGKPTYIPVLCVCVRVRTRVCACVCVLYGTECCCCSRVSIIICCLHMILASLSGIRSVTPPFTNWLINSSSLPSFWHVIFVFSVTFPGCLNHSFSSNCCCVPLCKEPSQQVVRSVAGMTWCSRIW